MLSAQRARVYLELWKEALLREFPTSWVSTTTANFQGIISLAVMDAPERETRRRQKMHSLQRHVVACLALLALFSLLIGAVIYSSHTAPIFDT